jgi:hypothetical protein
MEKEELNSKYEMLGIFLVNEAIQEEIEDWDVILQKYILDLMDLQTIYKLTSRARLAICIIIIGSRNIEYFPLAFQLMCEWDELRGCYSVIQQEILRHSAIDCLRFLCNFHKYEMTQNIIEQFEQNFNEILPEKIPKYVKNQTLVQKLIDLRIEIVNLVNEMLFKSKQKKIALLKDYEASYPFEMFIKWFLNRAQKLLVESGKPYFQQIYGDKLSKLYSVYDEHQKKSKHFQKKCNDSDHAQQKSNIQIKDDINSSIRTLTTGNLAEHSRNGCPHEQDQQNDIPLQKCVESIAQHQQLMDEIKSCSTTKQTNFLHELQLVDTETDMIENNNNLSDHDDHFDETKRVFTTAAYAGPSPWSFDEKSSTDSSTVDDENIVQYLGHQIWKVFSPSL